MIQKNFKPGQKEPPFAALRALATHGYAIDLRPVFEAEARTHLNDAEALIARAAENKGLWVLWDPSDDADGFLLVGNDPFAMAVFAVAYLEIET
jgi:hypothetical protein